MIFEAIRRLFGGGQEPPGGLGCEEAMALIQDFIDGELDPAAASNVEEHFEVCARCYPQAGRRAAPTRRGLRGDAGSPGGGVRPPLRGG